MLQLKIPRLTPNMHNLVRKNNLINNINIAASSPITASNKSVLVCKPLPAKRTEQYELCEIDLTSPVKPTQPPPRLEEFTIESPFKKKANESRMDLTVSDPNEPKVDLMKQVINKRFQLKKSPIIPLLLNPTSSKGPDEENEPSESDKNKKNAKRDIENTDKNESIENKREKRQKRNSFLVPQDPIQTVPVEIATSSKNISTETSLNDKTPKPKKKLVITTSTGNTSKNRSLISKELCKEMYEKRMQQSSLLTNDSLYSNVSKTSTALGSSIASNFNSVNGSTTSSSSSRKRIVIMTNDNRGKTPRVDPFRSHMIKAGFGAKFADKG